jgi:hypothetical protein
MQYLHICSNFGKRETETKRFLTEVEPARAAERWDPVISVDLIKKCGHFVQARIRTRSCWTGTKVQTTRSDEKTVVSQNLYSEVVSV